MIAVILAGGRGTRLAEETDNRPKPLVAIGGRPIIWHIMNIYGHHGVTDFVVCLGYKGYLLKEYFSNLALHDSDVTIDLGTKETRYHDTARPPWRITLVDTGIETLTGGRLKRVQEYLTEGEPFCMTYGDGVSDVNVGATIDFHRNHGLLATLTAVRPTARFGTITLDGERVVAFDEKQPNSAPTTNGGFFVLQPQVLDYIEGDDVAWEDALRSLAKDGQLAAFPHYGFWQPMDTLWEKNHLESLWATGSAPWKVWA